MKTLILASSSPSRTYLMQRLKLPFIAVPPLVEEIQKEKESIADMVQRLAEEKARAVSSAYSKALIIGSDTAALTDGEILGKPLGYEKAFLQLKKCSGKKVDFYTGLCLLSPEEQKIQTLVERYSVYFKHLKDKNIEQYLKKEQPYSCSGSIKSEGLGIALFEKMEGEDPNTLLGLPLIRLIELLNVFGVTVI